MDGGSPFPLIDSCGPSWSFKRFIILPTAIQLVRVFFSRRVDGTWQPLRAIRPTGGLWTPVAHTWNVQNFLLNKIVVFSSHHCQYRSAPCRVIFVIWRTWGLPPPPYYLYPTDTHAILYGVLYFLFMWFLSLVVPISLTWPYFINLSSAMEEDHVHENSNDPSQELERPEPVRSRWTPKPEQIMIMESIFNTGLVNPSKDETVRIRKQLEKFGSVADANVFYWFQNRRSRSRRRQRQIKALMANNPQILGTTGAIPYEHTSPLSVGSFASSSSSPWVMAPSSCEAFDNNGSNNHFSVSQQTGLQEMEQMPMVSSIILPSNNANLHYQSG